MFRDIDLEEALKKARQQQEAEEQESLLREVRSLLLDDLLDEVSVHIKLASPEQQEEELAWEGMDRSRVYNLAAIQRICINYRLRFLCTSAFKGELPKEAIFKAKAIEKALGYRVKEYKLLAPAKVFKLGDRHKDPLLFANLGNGRYYLIHRWGNDLKWYRRIWAYPWRNAYCLAFSLFMVAGLLSVIAPTDWLTTNTDAPYFNRYRFLLFFWCLMFLAVSTTYAGFAFQKQFSVTDWKNRDFN